MSLRKLIIQPTGKTPKVVFDPESYTFLIEGRSIPEDSVSFYRKLYGWVENVGPQLTGTVEFDFRLEYFNTSSSKCLLDLFKMIQRLHEQNDKVIVNWYVEDEDPDMEETGEDYKSMLEMPFNVIMES